MTKPSKIRAFTLIELLVVIAIIAILTSVVIAAIAPSKAKARDAKRISDLGQIQLALELYFDRCRSYPNEASGGGVDLTSSCSTSNGTVNLNSFIAQIPLDPNGQPYDYLIAIANSVPVDYILHT
ncbi:MAG: type II secretion system protein, partial [Patescibacteria group bacterium]|nr:type II secretion system protein [Patescibacteria group bacterium]